jgi:dephospho-CoA kinase
MLRIGLTGGIGSGKSTVAEMFRRRGAPIIDTDEIARDVVTPGQPALKEIAAAFGAEVLDAAGGLDRARIRAIVFDNPQQRQRLEAILHPRIRTLATLRVAELPPGPYCITVVPLLVETRFDALVDRVLVVDCTEEQQIARAIARDRISKETVRKIMAAQVTRQQRLAHAHDVITNTGDLAHLEREVDRLDRQYRQSPQMGAP